MRHSIADATEASNAVADAIRQLMSRHNRPILIAIDGASGSDKSSFALRLASEFKAAFAAQLVGPKSAPIWIHIRRR